MFRVGFGQDSHRFSKNRARPLVLAGVNISDEIGFESNSDGDAVLHALCNAIESAIGGESFSIYADPMHREGIINSREYIKVALLHMKEKGYQIGNVSIAIEAKLPKILPITPELKLSLSEILGLSTENIGLTATSGEELTVFGQGEGVQVLAIVSLVKK